MNMQVSLRFFLGLLFVFTITLSKAQEITIRGNNPDYKSQKLDLLSYRNLITSNEKKVVSVLVDTSGNFEFKFHIDSCEYVFMHLGIFFTFLYAEPGNTYEVKLPPFTPKKQDEKLNPFFQETPVHLLILSVYNKNKQKNTDPDEINNLTSLFDAQYDTVFTKFAVRTYTLQETRDLDSFINILHLKYDNSKNAYFQKYFNYRIGLLKFTTARLRSRVVSYDWFLKKPVLYNNPAYMELFNQVYDKYFVFYGRTRLGKKIYTDINSYGSLSQLKQTLAIDDVLKNDTLKELVILKAIHDGFYEMEFSRKGLLNILDSLIDNTKIALHKDIGIDIREKVTKLLEGYTPPAFTLYDSNRHLVSLDDFKGQYVYLNFCTTQNYACLKDLEQLKRINDKYSKYITIISISVDESFQAMQSYVKKKGYKWTFLHYENQPDIIRDYDIRIFPTYYLIGRDGKLVWSPAPSPNDNFDQRLFEELRAKKIL